MPRANSHGEHAMIKRLGAEFIGTFWLVLGGCGSAVLAANFGGDGNPLGIGLLGVALAFGLTVLTGAYALGHISGGHFNPAVSFGLWAGGRFPAKDLLPYIVAQVAGGILAGFILLQIASGTAGFAIDNNSAGALHRRRADGRRHAAVAVVAVLGRADHRRRARRRGLQVAGQGLTQPASKRR